VIDPESRSITVLLQVDNPDQALKIGMLADARLILGSAVSGTAVPTETIQNEDGIPVAYVQTGGELFERRVLTLGVTDGAWTIVSEGLSPGEHVVTRGAYQVRLASLSTSELATHGHVH
jgi:multidrug efflux pump subunit AcrA (membrane-fusion protein)